MNTTPDVERVDLGFEPEEPHQRWRTALGSTVLYRMLLGVGSRAAIALDPSRRRSAERMWARAMARAARITIETSGLHHLRSHGGPVLVMPLHESFVDVVALLHLPLDLTFTVRDELLDLGVAGRYLDTANQIVVPESGGVAAFRRMHERVRSEIEAGTSVVVFPQGSVLGVEVAFNQGIASLARTTGAAIVPVAMSGGHRVWEYPFSQTVRFGQTIAMTILAPIRASEATSTRLRDTERRMKSVALANQRAPVRRFVPERDGWWDGYAFEIDPDFTELRHRIGAHRTSVPDQPER
ncbi:MAG: lysophospholipid acyltransferase family protein [Acidimicrobiia bacterium]|nr:lysophospholipid acyltransferase family protein [Acidimicrobiia bacterium]